MKKYFAIWYANGEVGMSANDCFPVGVFDADTYNEAEERFVDFTEGRKWYSLSEISKRDFDQYSSCYSEKNSYSFDNDDKMFAEAYTEENVSPNKDEYIIMYFAIWKLEDGNDRYPVSLFVANSVSEAVERFNDYRAGETWYKLQRIHKDEYEKYYKYIYDEFDYNAMRQAEVSRRIKKDHPNILYTVSSVRKFIEDNAKAKHLIENDFNQSIDGLNKDELVQWLADHDDLFKSFKVELGLPNFDMKKSK